tara:strand:+ start:66138 stop:67028 length:891 start_codon:yes stop_codon:yes gene_type:complete
MNSLPTQHELQFPLDDGVHNLRDDRDILSMPYFASGAKGQVVQHIRVELETSSDQAWVDIKGTEDGIADMFDKRILLFIRMMLDQSTRDGRELSRTVRFAPYDYFQAIGTRRPSKKDYEAFDRSLDRLKGTYIKSSVDAVLPDGEIIRGNMRRGWIDEADYIEHRNATGVVKRGVRIRVSEWLFAMWMQAGKSLAVPREYFQIRSPIKMRIYELCRRFVGNQRVPVRMNLALFHQRINGGEGRPTDLKKKIREVQDEGGILGYDIRLEPHRKRTPPRRVIVCMTNALLVPRLTSIK